MAFGLILDFFIGIMLFMPTQIINNSILSAESSLAGYPEYEFTLI